MSSSFLRKGIGRPNAIARASPQKIGARFDEAQILSDHFPLASRQNTGTIMA